MSVVVCDVCVFYFFIILSFFVVVVWEWNILHLNPLPSCFKNDTYYSLKQTIISFSATFTEIIKREGEGQRIRNRIIQKMKHREALKKEAMDRGESVEDWERIVLVGAKIKQPTTSASEEES